MKLEDQVCSLELAKRLKELGVKQNAIFEWVKCSTLNEWIWRLLQRDDDDHVNERISAFTVAELGEMLPPYYSTQWIDAKTKYWICKFDGIGKGTDRILDAMTEADARAKMLCYLIEQKLVTP